MRDLYHNIKLVRAIFPQAVGTTGAGNGVTSPAIDLRGYDSCMFSIEHGTAGATGDTTVPILFECDTATGTFTSVADDDMHGTEAAAGLPVQATARTSGTGKNLVTKLGYKGNKRFVKLRLYGLGHATGLVAATAVLGSSHLSPVA